MELDGASVGLWRLSLRAVQYTSSALEASLRFYCTLDPLTPWVPSPCGPGPLSEGMSDGWLAAVGRRS